MTDVRPPLPPDEGVTVLRPQLGGPTRDPEPDADRGNEPAVEGLPPDPEAAIDTQEISLTELRAAARAAGVELDEVEVPARDDVVDLVAAEQDAEPVETVRVLREPEPADAAVTVEPDSVVDADAEPDAPVATYAGPFGEPGTPIDADVEADLDTELDAEPDVDPALGLGTGYDATDAEGIDPRIHERRVAVTAAQLARRRRLGLLAVAVASVVGILWLIVQAPFLSVQHVQVRGATAETRAAVERAAAVKQGSALLFLDTGEIAKRVEALPWVAEASVRRDLPNGVTIDVEERLPVAWVRRPAPFGSPPGTPGPVAVVDVSGRILADEPEPPAGLPAIIGLEDVPPRGTHLPSRATAAALAALPDPLRAQTMALILRRGQGVLQLKPIPNGGPPAADEVRLGRLEQVAQKGAAALAVLDQLLRDGDRVRYVDVRVPASPATR